MNHAHAHAHASALFLSLVASAAVAIAQEASPVHGGDPGTLQPASLPPSTLARAWQQALATMRAQKAPGLVFVLPPAGVIGDPARFTEARARLRRRSANGGSTAATTTRDLLLLHLQILRQAPVFELGPDGQRRVGLGAAFGLAVPVVATAATCGAKPGETLVLLGEDGKRRTGLVVDLADAVAVDQALRSLLLTPESFAARAANVPADVSAAVDVMLQPHAGEGEDADRSKLRQMVSRQLHAAAPALLARDETSAADAHNFQDGRRTLGWFLQFTTPLGTEADEKWDPCPPCGMMAAPLPMRSALRLLAE